MPKTQGKRKKLNARCVTGKGLNKNTAPGFLLYVSDAQIIIFVFLCLIEDRKRYRPVKEKGIIIPLFIPDKEENARHTDSLPSSINLSPRNRTNEADKELLFPQLRYHITLAEGLRDGKEAAAAAAKRTRPKEEEEGDDKSGTFWRRWRSTGKGRKWRSEARRRRNPEWRKRRRRGGRMKGEATP